MKISVLVASLCAALLVTVLVTAPVLAHGDKVVSTFVSPGALIGLVTPPLTGPLGGSFVNGASKGKFKANDKCKVQIQLKNVLLPDSDQISGTGDEVICILDRNETVGGVPSSSSLVLRGAVKTGKVKIKTDLMVELGPGVCTPSKKGGPSVQIYDVRTTCFEPDPGYAPVITLPFFSDPSQGLVIPGYAPRPASPMIATTGIGRVP